MEITKQLTSNHFDAERYLFLFYSLLSQFGIILLLGYESHVNRNDNLNCNSNGSQEVVPFIAIKVRQGFRKLGKGFRL